MPIITIRDCRRGPWPSASLRYQPGQPNQIVGGGREGEGPSDTIAAAEPGLLLPGHDLDPAECFLDALPVTLADGVAALLRRAAVDRRAAAAGVLRDKRRYPIERASALQSAPSVILCGRSTNSGHGSFFTFGANTAVRNFVSMSSARSRSRFLENSECQFSAPD